MDSNTEYDKSHIERLKHGLYKPGEEPDQKGYDSLSPSSVEVENNWGDTEIISARNGGKQPSWVIRTLKTIVILAILSVVGSGGYLVYQYFDPLGKPSDKNIIITLETPVGVTPGIPADIVVRITNQNRVALEYANLSLLYPSGTRVGDNSDKDMRDQKKVFGSIEAGESMEFRTKAIFLGVENEEKELRALVEYRFAGINSIFTKENSRPVRLLAAPINLTVASLKEVNAGQQIDLSLNAVSNTVIALRDVFIRVDYPQGFTFSDASPKPTFGNNIWRVGTLDPSEKYSIQIRGVLEGADTQQRVFQTSVGVGSDKTERDIATLYTKAISEVVVRRPFIGIKLAFNDKPAGDVLAVYGQSIRGVITYQNNLPTQITNAQIEMTLKGVVLDRTSVLVGRGGFFSSIDNTILWDERGDKNLSILESGATGEVGFSFRPLPPVTGNQLITNPVISAEVTVRGKRMSDVSVPEEIKTVLSQNVRISSQAQIAARSVHFTGPFTNSGPIPPKVEQETTYTVIWSIVNTSNNIASGRIRATLPPYVKWYGSVFPSKESITYNKNTNEIIWQPGEIPAGTGIGKPPREVAFQIVFTPSLSQIDLAPRLVTDMFFSGIDTFTNTEITQKITDVTTRLSTDPNVTTAMGKVVE